MSETAVPVRKLTAAWVGATILAALVVPFLGGFIVAWLSTFPRFRDASPRLWVLLVIAAVVVAVQLALLFGPVQVTNWGGPVMVA